MAQINDTILAAIGGNNLPDDLLAHYQANGATSTNIMVAEREFLEAALGTADSGRPIADLWMDALTQEGYITGTLDDRRKQFWENESGVFTFIP